MTIDTAPQEASEDSFIIKLMVDPTNEVKESNENNNSKGKGCIAIPGKK
jgi:subtilase family serine protease